MKNYLIEDSLLGGFVDQILNLDEFMKYGSERYGLRDWAMEVLDKNIGIAIFGRLTEDQRNEFLEMTKNDSSEEDYRGFFAKTGLNLEEIMKDEMMDLKNQIIERLEA